MTQQGRRGYLLRELLGERQEYAGVEIPAGEAAQKKLLRSLFNLRMPGAASREFLAVQDAYLQEEIRRKGITGIDSLAAVRKGIYLWQGDITTLRCGAIVNAANSQMLGCFCPCHGCIDNAIHTYAGIELRLACAGLMEAQGHSEAVGGAKITSAYNLPCRYIVHTVGPAVHGRLTRRDERLLASCYRSCLALAEENRVDSLAFCCISTGEFHFPNDRAAEIAARAVEGYLEDTGSRMEVIFNVFKDSDYRIYRRLLGAGTF